MFLCPTKMFFVASLNLIEHNLHLYGRSRLAEKRERREKAYSPAGITNLSCEFYNCSGGAVLEFN